MHNFVPNQTSVLIREQYFGSGKCQYFGNGKCSRLLQHLCSRAEIVARSEMIAASPCKSLIHSKQPSRFTLQYGQIGSRLSESYQHVTTRICPFGADILTRESTYCFFRLPNFKPQRLRIISWTQGFFPYLEPSSTLASPQILLWFLVLFGFLCTRVLWSRMSTPRALEVIAGPGDVNKAVIARVDQLREPYKPSVFFLNKHVETIFAAFLRSLPYINFRRECLRMDDGGTVALDWPIAGADKELWSTKPSDGAPVLILLPGLTGGSGDTYVRHLLLRARSFGWNSVVFNSRGCAQSPVTTPQFYSASFTEDLRKVVKHVRHCFPTSRLYAVGWSLGANILVRYIGQEGESCLLAAAVSLCNPFDLVIADEDFRKGFNNVYDKSLAKGLRNILKRHVSLFNEIGGNYQIMKAVKAKTVRDFDDGLTRVSFGYNSVDDYYKDASSSRSIGDVKIPLLCIQAANDPIAPSRGIPHDKIENPCCLLVVTPYGGHLGWVAGDDAPFGAPWTDSLTMCYLQSIHSILQSGPTTKTFQQNIDELELTKNASWHAHSCKLFTNYDDWPYFHFVIDDLTLVHALIGVVQCI
ncbi:hypothetical protein O6H91_11G055900 [Diphasiastrum complanatum]|uniref:Uncharacterized protein n=1 Tax=Diphasiastrum complanatum TaxID=34168 RepID=A0ACC2C966_DIPCM|nr:hypothetical protein O6H91_11G055900 [Diphasiastrum complanatum]